MSIRLNLVCSALVLCVVGHVVESCNSNLFQGKDVRATGDWSTTPWNAADPSGLMSFDAETCEYLLVVSGLRADTQYKWKLVIDNRWNWNYGCNNGANCEFRSSPEGKIRFVVSMTGALPKLGTDYTVGTSDGCSNPWADKTVRAIGQWNNFQTNDAASVMNFESATCSYVLILSNLEPNKDLVWQVIIGNTFFGCGSSVVCSATTDADGKIRYVFRPDSNELSADFDYEAPTTLAPAATTAQPVTTKPVVTGPVQSDKNPIKECVVSKCPVCNNGNFDAKLIRAVGDWAMHAGSSLGNWSAVEPLGLMTYEKKLCKYTLLLTGLRPSFKYEWKVTIDNSFRESYGCAGNKDSNCQFTSDLNGAIRLVFNGSNKQLTSDNNVLPCGDGACQTGETCSACEEDCGRCPPPVCGNSICEETESFQTCAVDCPAPTELPGCERFNDEGCRSGDQIHANPGVEKRRWQTPKPGSPNYQESYQDYYALVGYGDIRYTSTARTEADVCIIATHKDPSVTLTYLFDGVESSEKCKRFTSSHAGQVALNVRASDGTKLTIPSMDLYWNRKTLANRPGDFRNGQKGAVAEFFGWPHKDVEKECELLAKAGYLGAKLFPVHEQVMSYQPMEDAMNPWYFMYQPVSYKLDGRAGTREDLTSLINTCRSLGVRVYVDVILNHFSGAGNDMQDHRNPNGCTKWGNKTSSAPIERQSPFYTHAYTYKYNPNTGEPPSNEFPGAALGPSDFHCDRILGAWSDLFILNNGWLVGLTDIDTSLDHVRERQAAYLVELMSLGVSGFRIDAAKHMSPEDIAAVLKKVQTKMGGQLPDDFFVWLEVLTGGEAGLIWFGPSWYGTSFERTLLQLLGSQSEVDKIKMWDGLYPKEPQNNPISKKRVVIQNDDHDQQNPGSSSRDMGPFGCVLIKDCPEETHRNFEIKLFENPNGASNNAEDWPIRFILSSYYYTNGNNKGIPDGWSDCNLCEVTCSSCRDSVPYKPAYEPGTCAYKGSGYTRVHRDVRTINAMRKWMGLGPISGADIGLPGCN